MGCGTGICRYLLFIFNFLFALCGIALIVVGSLAIKNSGGTIKDFISGDVSGLAIVLIVVGSVTFIIAFSGCCGAIRESHCMLITFSILLLTVFVIQLAISIYAFVNRDAFQDEADKIINDIFSKDEDTVNGIETLLQCCGVNGPSPVSFNKGCCKNFPDQTCSYIDRPVTYWDRGCIPAFKEFMRSSYIIIGGISIGIAFVEICGAVIGLSIANSIRRSERRNY